MTVNQYFNHFQNDAEQSLYNDLCVESIQLYGKDVLYVPREDVVIDPMLNEPIETTFRNVYPIEMYLKSVMGFDGQGDFLSKFGIQAENNVQLMCSKTRFEELAIPNRNRPLEGDLIYFGLNTPSNPTGYGTFINNLFIVTFADREAPELFWQHGTFYAYTINLSLFTQSYERFNTGNEALDQFDPHAKGQDSLNIEELSFGNNEHTKETGDGPGPGDGLLDFDEDNPFGDL